MRKTINPDWPAAVATAENQANPELFPWRQPDPAEKAVEIPKTKNEDPETPDQP